jgi:protein TonB
MEIKKSSSADLDKRRWLDFLCGAVLVLVALYVALEYDWAVHDDEFDAEALENIVKELDLEALKEEERIPLIKEQVVERPQSADKLNIVEEEPDVELKDELPPPENDVELKTVDEVKDPEQPVAVDLENNPLNFRVVEELPEFPGGAVAFMQWLTKNLRYPPSAQQRGVQGKVLAQFIVNTDGSISNIEILK